MRNIQQRQRWISLVIVCGSAPAAAQMPVVRVVIEEARTLEAPATITLVGTVEAVRVSRVASQVAGLVRSMPVRQGDHIDANQVICELDNETSSFAVAQAKAEWEARRARHRELLAGTRKEELTRLKALLDEAIADYDRWRFEMQRIDELYASAESNAKEYHDTRAEFLAAQRRNIAAEARFDEAVAGPRSEVIARAAADVAAQRAALDREIADLRRMVVRAPFAGVVTDRVAEIGEWVPVGGTVVELADLSSVLVSVDLPESALPYIAIGDPARVTVDALGRSFDGIVKHIIRRADARAHTFPVEVTVPNDEGLLAAGLFARVTVPGGAKREVVAVSKDAIVERDGITYIAVVRPGERGKMVGMLMGVSLGIEVGNWIAITSDNVRPGTPIVTRGNELIMPFPTPVIIVDDKGTPVAPSESKPKHPAPTVRQQ